METANGLQRLKDAVRRVRTALKLKSLLGRGGGKPSKWSQVKMVSSNRGIAKTMQYRNQVYSQMQSEALNAMASKGVMIDSTSNPWIQQVVPVWDQGNLSHYTPDALALRLALKNDRSLKRGVDRYWTIKGS